MKVSFVATLPDGFEYFDDIEMDHHYDVTMRDFATKAVRTHGTTTNRKNPVNVKVKIDKLVLVKGKVQRIHYTGIDVPAPFAPMTEKEFQEELDKELSQIPTEFHPFINKQSWDRGHSAGYEEVLNIAQEMTYELKPCVAKFEDRLYNS